MHSKPRCLTPSPPSMPRGATATKPKRIPTQRLREREGSPRSNSQGNEWQRNVSHSAAIHSPDATPLFSACPSASSAVKVLAACKDSQGWQGGAEPADAKLCVHRASAVERPSSKSSRNETMLRDSTAEVGAEESGGESSLRPLRQPLRPPR